MLLPEKGIPCHRTFARAEGPIDCRDLVCAGCRLWKHVAAIVDRNPETGEAIAKDQFDCIDSLQELFWKDFLRRQLQTTATVDKLAKEVRDANDGGMANALLGINREIARQNEALGAGAPMAAIANGMNPKRIEETKD